MSNKSDAQPYLSLADAVAVLGGGEDGVCRLGNGHVEGRVVLCGRLRDKLGLADVSAPIPPHALAGWKPAGGGAVRFNLEASSIEANAGFVDFGEFYRRAPYGYEDVQVAAHEVDALAKSLNGREATKAKAETDCRKWLCEKMAANRDRPEPRSLCHAAAAQKFDVGARAFGRAWDAAIHATGAVAWSRPGPRGGRENRS